MLIEIMKGAIKVVDTIYKLVDEIMQKTHIKTYYFCKRSFRSRQKICRYLKIRISLKPRFSFMEGKITLVGIQKSQKIGYS